MIFLYTAATLSGMMRALAENPTGKKIAFGRGSASGEELVLKMNSGLACCRKPLGNVSFKANRI
jgi:hypothetical protein